MKIMIFGAGNIGSTLVTRLQKENITDISIVRSSGIFDVQGNKIAKQQDWKLCATDANLAFICIPTTGKGDRAFEYEMEFLSQGKPVISCEKASIAHHWDELKRYKDIFKYTASVGGGTKMLNKISKYNSKDIQEIKGVVNGTLNYISDSLKYGKSKGEIVTDVLNKKYAEPGANTFDEIINGEMNDVVLKTLIIANHSGIFEREVSIDDIKVTDFIEGKRCIIKITRNDLEVGFIEDNNAGWLPDLVNNVLYVNEERKAYGPGAGADATVDSMMSDYFSFQSK